MGTGAFLLFAISLGDATYNPYSATLLLLSGLVLWAAIGLSSRERR